MHREHERSGSCRDTVLVYRLTPGLDVVMVHGGLDVVMVHGGHRLVASRLLSVDIVEWVSRRRGERTETRFKSWYSIRIMPGWWVKSPGSHADAIGSAVG